MLMAMAGLLGARVVLDAGHSVRLPPAVSGPEAEVGTLAARAKVV